MFRIVVLEDDGEYLLKKMSPFHSSLTLQEITWFILGFSFQVPWLHYRNKSGTCFKFVEVYITFSGLTNSLSGRKTRP